jgi:hypothetical protein
VFTSASNNRTINSEKVIKQDTDRKYDIVVIGEESHVAYNRVGLSTFFEHRKIEDLYLNPKEWVSVNFSEFETRRIHPNWELYQLVRLIQRTSLRPPPKHKSH